MNLLRAAAALLLLSAPAAAATRVVEAAVDHEDWRALGWNDACGVAFTVLAYSKLGTGFAAEPYSSRAGAMTCLELIHFKLPCVLIPLPQATESHQLANAKHLEGLGLARVLQEGEGFDQTLYQALKEILSRGRRSLGTQVKLDTAIRKTFKEVIEEIVNTKHAR